MRAERMSDLAIRGTISLRRRFALWPHLNEAWKRTLCTAAQSSRLHAQCRIENLRREGGQPDRSAIVIGAYVQVLAQLKVFPHGGRIQVGEYSFLGEQTRVWSASSITIGNRVQIAHGVNIHDTISHSLSAESRFNHLKQIFSTGHPSILDDVPSAPIVIEDDVWIGFNSVILKGVTIGKGAVVGAASVVTKDVPPYVIVVGNPAKVVGRSQP